MTDNKNENLGFAGKIAKTFVMNSRLSILLIITIFVWGLLSFLITPKQYNPEIVAPAFNVITNYEGASSFEVEEIVSKPLEDKIIDIDRVEKVMTQSIDGGTSIVTVQFFVGEDLEDSKIKLTQKIRGSLDQRPIGVSEPIVKDIDPNDVPVQVIALSSDLYSASVLRKIAFDIKNEIKKVKNTSNIEVFGGRTNELRIELNPQEMNSRNISVREIYTAIENANRKIISGELKESLTNKILVEVDASVTNVNDLKNIVLKIEGEHIVYLGDVTSILKTENEINSYTQYIHKGQNGDNNVVYLSIAKRKDTNISSVTKAVRKKISSLEKTKTLDNIELTFLRDEGLTASEEIFGLVINLIQAIVIVSLILFIFLGRQAAFIVAIAIPLVLASVFGIGLLSGQTINRITLFALILSLGLLVDNATVIVENAVRHLNKFKKTHGTEKINKKDAVIKAVDEVGAGLLMSTITTLLAFYPMAFVTGMMGPYMGPIPFFVPVALMFSLIIAFTINPFLSSVFLSARDESKNNIHSNKFIISIQSKVSRWKEKINNNYKKLLTSLFSNKNLRKKVLSITAIVFLLVMLLPLLGIVKFRMLPKADREQFYIYLDLPEGTHLEKTKAITETLENFLLNEKEIISLQSFVGTPPIVDFNGLFKGSSARAGDNFSTIKVNLSHHKTRKIKSERLVQELRPKVYEILKNEQGLKIQLIEDPPGPPVLSTVLVKVKGNNYELIKKISEDVENMFITTKEVVDIDSSRTEQQEKLSLRVDYDKASRAGIDASQIAQTMQIALGGANISVLHDKNSKEQEYIFMRFKEDYRQNIDSLKQIYLSNNRGEKVPLTEIVEIQNGSIEDVLRRDNQEATVLVSAEMGKRGVTYAVIDVYKKLFNYTLPNNQGEIKKISFFGITFLDKQSGEEYRVEWGGEWKITVEVFRDLGAAMMVAIFLIYVVLVAQFRSFRVPLLIMITIPLAMIGVLPGFAFLGFTKGIYFNATSMIGVIALAGIVVNNAIILVEYLNSYKEKNTSIEQALIKTGLTRMRPIVLTSLTTILGSLTIIGDPVWAGLAWSIIFGISISTLLTLILFPVLYFTFMRKDWN